ncbi:MAG TPA: glycosyltransferase, partial [Thermoanaerobaculia bacterium]|nr:glycosyltransferase [Thermoanaerobaculia bacterium]
RGWLSRMYIEYVWFDRWSRTRDVDTWLSLHDVTPNVRARHRHVYCHNATAFDNGPRRWREEPRFEVFRSLYPSLYRTNIKKNDFVIVQQQWMRDRFAAMFGLDKQRIIVARPQIEMPPQQPPEKRTAETLLVYPALPRFFKNYEILFEVMERLRGEPVRLAVTFSGDETRYARALVSRYGRPANVDFVGHVSRDEVMRLYASADALVFPSTLETWGLPLTEIRAFDKPVFAAALPYAYETLSGYDKAAFFDPHDAESLLRMLIPFVRERRFEASPVTVDYAPPLANDWPELLQLLGLW